MGFQKKSLFLSFSCVLALGIAPVFSGVSYAQDIEKLTKDNVTEFIEKTTSITVGEDATYMDPDEIVTYLDRHIHKDARFVSTMRFTFPGMAPQDTKLSLNKNDFIDSVEKGDKALDNYESEIEIKKIKISKDKTKATVYTIGKEAGEIPTPLEDGRVQYVPVEGVSECTQILMLNDRGYIQMYNANCLTAIDLMSF